MRIGRQLPTLVICAILYGVLCGFLFNLYYNKSQRLDRQREAYNDLWVIQGEYKVINEVYRPCVNVSWEMSRIKRQTSPSNEVAAPDGSLQNFHNTLVRCVMRYDSTRTSIPWNIDELNSLAKENNWGAPLPDSLWAPPSVEELLWQARHNAYHEQSFEHRSVHGGIMDPHPPGLDRYIDQDFFNFKISPESTANRPWRISEGDVK
jgi:hypothetical protein